MHAILFLLAAGAKRFCPPFAMFAGEGCSRALAVFFSLPILSFKITTASPVLEHCGEKTSRLFLAKTKSKSLVMIDQPPKNPKTRQHNLQGRDREGRTVQKRFFGWKAFPFDPECFRDFQQKILLTWKAPQEIIAFQRPLSRALMETSAQDPSPHPL